MHAGARVDFSLKVRPGAMNLAVKYSIAGREIARPPRKQTWIRTENMPIGEVVTRPWMAEGSVPKAVRRG